MAGKVLLDTNVVIGLLRGDAAVLAHVARIEEVLVPWIALGELFYGAMRSREPNESRTQIEEFASDVVILYGDLETTRWYARIKDDLRRIGRPIPENDVWIAALARQHDLTLWTRDGHFSSVENLHCASW